MRYQLVSTRAHDSLALTPTLMRSRAMRALLTAVYPSFSTSVFVLSRVRDPQLSGHMAHELGAGAHLLGQRRKGLCVHCI